MTDQLEEIDLLGPQGTNVRVKKGDLVAFINPEIFDDGRTQSLHQSMLKHTEEEIGPGPYVVRRIERYGNGSEVLLIQGTENREKTVNEAYLTKAG